MSLGRVVDECMHVTAVTAKDRLWVMSHNKRSSGCSIVTLECNEANVNECHNSVLRPSYPQSAEQNRLPRLLAATRLN